MSSAHPNHLSMHLLLGVWVSVFGCTIALAQPNAPEPSQKAQETTETSDQDDVDLFAPPKPPQFPAPLDAIAMPKPHRVWVDKKNSTVFVDGYVSLNEGLLEMFACPIGTKEHESIVAVYSSAQTIHAALLAVGAKTGTPVQWDPKFKPPTGTEIEIEVHWQIQATKDGLKRWRKCSAQLWLTDHKTQKPMTHPWVFAGSGFWKDEESGQEHYLAEVGDLICVSNFSSATLDVPINSSQVNEGLLYEVNTSVVPSIGTPVRLALKPKFKKKHPTKKKLK